MYNKKKDGVFGDNQYKGCFDGQAQGGEVWLAEKLKCNISWHGYDASEDDAYTGGFSPGNGTPPESDAEHGEDHGPPPVHVPDVTPANSIIANTKDMLKLMVDTWEPILGRYRARVGHGDGEHTEALPTWADFYAEYRQELPKEHLHSS